jgi:L-seryl-tRNA(Ser) seleniumtransferase
MEVSMPARRHGPLHPPSVEAVLALVRPRAGGRDAHAVLVSARATVAEERTRLADGAAARTVAGLADEVLSRLEAFEDPTLSALPAVINATGVILHTNLGRAPWPVEAIEAARRAAAAPLLLELDRATGRRGPRARLAEDHLVALTGAEDALVVTNNAAALALAVGLAGRGGGVAVSRGELVEIGGGVRIPDIVRRAGARLVEVGTTNRTRTADFRAVLADPAAKVRLVLRVHASNFVQSGFVEAPAATEVATLAHEHGAIVVDDLGSGALLPTENFGLAHEPMPAERLQAGADLVTFSGDKLVGGPQAGLVVGRADLVARLRRDPLARAMRPDKVTLAALAATLGLYRAGRATEAIPVWRMVAAPVSALRDRAHAIVARLSGAVRPVVSVVDAQATLGGGSLPGETLPSVALAVAGRRGRSSSSLLARLRADEPCVVARIEADRVLLDLRTVAPEDDAALAAALGRSLVT